MRVLIAPDSFGGVAGAPDVAEAIATGWRSVHDHAVVDLLPMSDGGPGFVAALASVLHGRCFQAIVSDALGRPVSATCFVADRTAYIEAAQAVGIHLLADADRDPLIASSFGVGELLAALPADVTRTVVGLGGSASNDGGAGLWAALGAEPADVLGAGGAALATLTSIERLPLSLDALVAATDVDNPLLGASGASVVYGPQKGADCAAVRELDHALEHWANLVESAIAQPGLRDRPGAGAAGGLGFGLFALGATRASGVELVGSLTRLEDRIRRADLVVTGEGRFDRQSLRGKVVSGVAASARAAGVPCILIAGQVDLDKSEAMEIGVERAYAVTDVLGDVTRAMRAGVTGISRTAAWAAGGWQ